MILEITKYSNCLEKFKTCHKYRNIDMWKNQIVISKKLYSFISKSWWWQVTINIYSSLNFLPTSKILNEVMLMLMGYVNGYVKRSIYILWFTNYVNAFNGHSCYIQ